MLYLQSVVVSSVDSLLSALSKLSQQARGKIQKRGK